jgi:hypothetical protein
MSPATRAQHSARQFHPIFIDAFMLLVNAMSFAFGRNRIPSHRPWIPPWIEVMSAAFEHHVHWLLLNPARDYLDLKLRIL